MDSLVLIVIFLAAIGAGFAMLDRRLRQHIAGQKDEQSLLMLNQNVQSVQSRLDENTKTLNTRLSENTRLFNERLDRAAAVIQGVTRELGTMQEIGRSMKDLQDFLRSPKLRGNIGEQVMKDLLEQYFPRAHFDLQHTFQTGDRVDAILKTDKGIIPIDAKFPLENFQKMQRADTDDDRAIGLRDFMKDIKKHINDIAKKYILPGEGTADFALMYVPSESVYYEIIQQNEDLTEFAHGKRVMLVSPNSFYYFLKVLMIGMEGKRMEEDVKRVLDTMRAIQQDATKFGDQLDVLTKHVTNAKNSVDRVNNEYSKLSGKIDDVRLLK